MSNYSFVVDHVAKRYTLGQGSASSLRETVSRILGRKRAAPKAGAPEELWALKDVSFSIRQGEAVGIIGRNGAGKSTLLKVLSRITAPTNGRIEIRGRVGSLLEVGTGFHPELTGRENVFLNGTILGMTRKEIRQKFDEIVEFAEVSRFLDTPVKYYSSGMYVRLAFAVAAHLEPEILLVDEVLAVGDSNFQRKCLQKMEDIGHQGRTVLFVSHNIASVTRLCSRAILLDHGAVLRDGPSSEVASVYLTSGLGTKAHREWPDSSKAPGNDVVRMRAIRVLTEDGKTAAAVDIRKPVGIEMDYEVLQDKQEGLWPTFRLSNEEGLCIFQTCDAYENSTHRHKNKGRFISTAWIPGNLLSEGSLIVSAGVTTFTPDLFHFLEPDAVAFQVVDSAEGDSARGSHGGQIPGVVRPLLKWSTEQR